MAIAGQATGNSDSGAARTMLVATLVMAVALVVAPHVGIYPVFLMKALCFALFACAFNLLIGFGGLLSFGHAMFLGTAGYVSAHAAKVWGAPPELAILAGTAAAALLGVVEGLTKVFYPEASNTVIFVVRVIVLLIKPAGLFGKER